jgi:hypothetical protein
MAVNVGISTTGSTRSINRRLHNLMHRQIPFAASKALNDTGNVLLAVNKREMRKQFDKPVRYTLNAFYMKPARKNDLNMRIARKSKPAGKHYLDVQHKGGVRPRKGVESMLNYSLAYSGDLRAVLPTSRTQTAAGGMSMARINEAIAGLQDSKQAGRVPSSSYTKAGITKQTDRLARRKKPVEYFIGYKSEGKNRTDGIYRRTGKTVKKMFHLLEYQPKYRPNFPFYPPLIRNARSYFPTRMKRQLAMAMRTARF